MYSQTPDGTENLETPRSLNDFRQAMDMSVGEFSLLSVLGILTPFTLLRWVSGFEQSNGMGDTAGVWCISSTETQNARWWWVEADSPIQGVELHQLTYGTECRGVKRKQLVSEGYRNDSK